MPTLKEVRQRMLRLDSSLGRVEAIASLTTANVIVSALAAGTIGAGKFANKWLLRPDTATTADRLRLTTSTGYNAATGTLTHGGAVYADTTATGESVEIHEHEPFLLDNAIQAALRGTRFLDRTYVPTTQSQRYSLAGLSWIADPSDVVKVKKFNVPVLSNNRSFEKWNGYSSGSLVPDGWTLAGSGATFARSSTARLGAYSLSVTRSGADATVSVTLPILDTGVAADNLRGQTVTVVAVGRSGQASSLRARITSEKADGTVVTTTNTSYHTGGGGWEEVSAEHTVAATADQVTISARVEVNETALIDELYVCIGSLNDSIRRVDYRGGLRVRGYQFEQGQPPVLYVNAGARGGQLLIETQRPYTAFTQSRVDAGTADADSTDAPLDLIAYGALYRLFEDLPESADQARKAEKYRRIYSSLQAQHLAVDDQDEPRGAELIPSPRNNRIARVR